MIGIGDLYDALFSRYGDVGWWPAGSADEVIIGAILTQNTSWGNVEKSLQSLKKAGTNDLGGISATSTEEIQKLIRSSGFYRQKSERLKNIARAIIERYGTVEAMSHDDLDRLKLFLSSLSGIGQETMDSILLYALGKRVFVVDKYTIRIFQRTGLMQNPEIGTVKNLVESEFADDLFRFRNLHGMLVMLAKEYCKTKPKCSGCPLRMHCDYALKIS